MTYPVDSKGNVRVDFVWGNFPIQPDDVREVEPSATVVANGPQNHGWTATGTIASAKLAQDPITVTLNQLSQDVAPDNHIIAAEEWDSYPASDGQVAGTDAAPYWAPIIYKEGTGVFSSGDNVTVPTVVGLNLEGAFETLHRAGLNVGEISYTSEGATLANNGTVHLQDLAAEDTVTQGSPCALSVYKYQDATRPGVTVPYGYVAG